MKYTLISLLFLASLANAGVAKFTTKHVVVPAAKSSYRASKAVVKATGKAAVVTGKTTKKVLY